MSSPERIGFIALTSLATVASLGFGRYWVGLYRDVPLGAPAWTFVVATCLLAFHLGSWFVRWLLLWRMREPIPLTAEPGLRVAAVTTFVPEAESLEMLEHTLKALVSMHYPHDTWVLDEGDTAEVAAICRRLGARHYSRRFNSRFQSDGGPLARRTKHGNYNAWLTEIGAEHYDILAAFDPDHVAEPDFLRRVLGYFRDPRVAYVQVPQVYYNQNTGIIARGAAEESYAYYSSHQMAGYGMGQPVLVGSHNTQRITALMEVGGFAPHDADDLLITLRYRASNWRGIYHPEVLALGTTPVDWHGYLRQQMRWTRSVIDIKLRHLADLQSALPTPQRFLSWFHGAYYLRSFTLPITYGLLAWLLMSGAKPDFLGFASLAWIGGLFCVLGLVGLFRRRFFLDPNREGGVHWRSAFLQFAKWPYQCLAIWKAFWGAEAPYALTLKVRRSGEQSIVLWPHWLIAAVLTVALVEGIRTHAIGSVELLVAGIVGTSIAIATSEFVPRPKPWDETTYRERRRELADLLGPTTNPGTARRRSLRTA